jgi:hypothetical protein
VVRVPVLSLQMTVVHPSVSTEGSVRTIAFSFAILFVPSAKQVVTTAGSPSGMAATAKATAICSQHQMQFSENSVRGLRSHLLTKGTCQ